MRIFCLLLIEGIRSIARAKGLADVTAVLAQNEYVAGQLQRLSKVHTSRPARITAAAAVLGREGAGVLASLHHGASLMDPSQDMGALPCA